MHIHTHIYIYIHPYLHKGEESSALHDTKKQGDGTSACVVCVCVCMCVCVGGYVDGEEASPGIHTYINTQTDTDTDTDTHTHGILPLEKAKAGGLIYWVSLVLFVSLCVYVCVCYVNRWMLMMKRSGRIRKEKPHTHSLDLCLCVYVCVFTNV
jgi:hypothetical protein